MIFRKLRLSDRGSASDLWRSIFEDSEEFTNWYFQKRFRPEHSFAAFDGDTLVSMTLGRGTEIFVGGRMHEALLISGVATLPEYRKQGLMHKLVQMQLDDAKASGFACCYLYPVQESIYASLGFRTGTHALLIRSDDTRVHKPFTIKEGENLHDMCAVYDAALRCRNGMQKRGEDEFRMILEDYAMDGSRTLIAYAENRPVGYICANPDGAELLALCAPAYECLLDEAAKREGKPLTAIAPPDCGVAGERVYGMQYAVFDEAFSLPLENGFCKLPY